MKTNEEKIKAIVFDLLEQSYLEMVKKVDKAMSAPVVDIENWREDDKPMILPKCIVSAIMQSESTQYEGKGTSYERQIKKDVKNIRYYI